LQRNINIKTEKKMICRNLTELRNMANQQCQAIRTDIANALRNFIQAKNTSPQEVARVLGLQESAIDALLNGTRDITLMELVTFMIATDKVVRIEDVNEAMGNMGNHRGNPFGRMPMGNRGHRMPMPPYGGMPNPNEFGAPVGGQMPPFGAPIGDGQPNPYGGAPMPPQFGAPVGGQMPPQFGGMPTPPPFGAPVGGQMPPQFEAPTPTQMGGNGNVPMNPSNLPDFDEMSRPQLIDFVRNNVENWQQSFGNLDNAKRSDIINFLNSIPLDGEPPIEAAAPSNEAFNYEQIGKNIAQMAQSNPALANMLETLMKK